jgi:hypothetical protein
MDQLDLLQPMWNKEQALSGFVERTLSRKVHAGNADLTHSADDLSDGGAQFFRSWIGRAGVERKVALRTLFAERLDPSKTLVA